MAHAKKVTLGSQRAAKVENLAGAQIVKVIGGDLSAADAEKEL